MTSSGQRFSLLRDLWSELADVQDTKAVVKDCKILLPWNLDAEDLMSFMPFVKWSEKLSHNLGLQENKAHAFHSRPYKLWGIEVQAADWFGDIDPRTGKSGKLGFVKMQVKIETEMDSQGRSEMTPGAVFLRGQAVGVLIILQPDDVTTEEEKYVVLAIQPRVAAASLAFAEIPAGMTDGEENIVGKVVNEIREETSLIVKSSELFNLSEGIASQSQITPWTVEGKDAPSGGEKLYNAMYPSVGGCDEALPLFLCQKKVPRDKMEKLQNLATGLHDEGENITLKLVPLNELPIHGGRDGKALAAYGLYQYHKSIGTKDKNFVAFHQDQLEHLDEAIAKTQTKRAETKAHLEAEKARYH
ncbi:hypothetical protein N0V90_006173 [Kalmusia sp. IMI 367209]|nr:hypothetical protein N0V90_006173 [Kalmusia sp. IMI 367209]